MPKQGVASSFKFGVNYGIVRMALTAAGIPFEEVTPQAWQKALGITHRKKTETPSEWKNRLRARAQQLFPSVSLTLATADALLIAEYCRRINK
jgi:Holliday junction resolvasome RuvABC endonuclease subunit